MLKTNLDLGNGTILKDVRVWEVDDESPKYNSGLVSDYIPEGAIEGNNNISSWKTCNKILRLGNGEFSDELSDNWFYFIPITEIVEAAMRQGKENA